MELDSAEEQNLIYADWEDEARLNLKKAADVEKNNDESESQNLFEIKDKMILAKHASCCQVRVDIDS